MSTATILISAYVLINTFLAGYHIGDNLKWSESRISLFFTALFIVAFGILFYLGIFIYAMCGNISLGIESIFPIRGYIRYYRGGYDNMNQEAIEMLKMFYQKDIKKGNKAQIKFYEKLAERNGIDINWLRS